jgi:hypothetical protein
MCGEVQAVQKYPAYLSLEVQATEVAWTDYVRHDQQMTMKKLIREAWFKKRVSLLFMGKGIHSRSDWLTGSSLQHCGELSPGQVKVLFFLSIVGLGSDQRVQI